MTTTTRTTAAGTGAHRTPADRIPGARTIKGRARTCLPAGTARGGGEPWHYPDGDDTAVVRGED